MIKILTFIAALMSSDVVDAQQHLLAVNRMLTTQVQRPAPVASEIWLDIGSLADGDYHLKIVGGVVTVVPVTIIIPGKPSPPPVPSLQKLSRDSAIAIGDPTTAGRLADAYSAVLRQTFQSVPEISRAARDAADALSLPAAWGAYRQTMGAELTRMAQDGLLATVPQYVAALTQIRDGLRDASRQGAF